MFRVRQNSHHKTSRSQLPHTQSLPHNCEQNLQSSCIPLLAQPSGRNAFVKTKTRHQIFSTIIKSLIRKVMLTSVSSWNLTPTPNVLSFKPAKHDPSLSGNNVSCRLTMQVVILTLFVARCRDVCQACQHCQPTLSVAKITTDIVGRHVVALSNIFQVN